MVLTRPALPERRTKLSECGPCLFQRYHLQPRQPSGSLLGWTARARLLAPPAQSFTACYRQISTAFVRLPSIPSPHGTASSCFCSHLLRNVAETTKGGKNR
ncbi:MAG: hypothetical protein MJA29_01755 [Candidatus Omnitrophica bacterium]|nr:hypothetical protein [Candidatus Omnitrophota bacterium]